MERLEIIRELYDFLYQATESFEEGFDDLGADALYLIGAVAKGTRCEWPRNRTLLRMLAEDKPKLFKALRNYLVLTVPECETCGSRLRPGSRRRGEMEDEGYCTNRRCSRRSSGQPLGVGVVKAK